jgi:hypothetical protein
MSAWVLIPCLVKLRDEFNQLAPNRDKASDGSIGDAAHAQTNSDHNPDEDSAVLRDHDADSKNEVHAIDVDKDLRQPGVDMEAVVQLLLQRCRAGKETRLKYIIFNRRIWSASSGWRTQDYHGANPHDHHAHFSGKYDTASESSTASWHLSDLEDDMPLSDTDLNKIRTIVKEEVDKRIDQLNIPAAPTPTQNAEATWNRFRNDVKFGWSDTAVNRLEAEITEAVVAGVPVERYPNNPKD